MSKTNKTTSRKVSQEPNVFNARRMNRRTAKQVIEGRLEEYKLAFESMRKEKVQLKQELEKTKIEMNSDRMFWYWLVQNYRFHFTRMSIGRSEGEMLRDMKPLRDNLETAITDLMLAPSEPHTAFTQCYHQDHKLHRVLAGSGVAKQVGFPDEILPESELA